LPPNAPRHHEQDAPDARSGSRRRRLAVAAVVVVAGVLAAALWWRSYSRSPAGAVAEMAGAAVAGDVGGVMAHIDTTSVAEQAVSDLLGMRGNALVDRYLARNSDADAAERARRAKGLLDEELAEHVRDGTLPTRVPLEAGSLKSLAARTYASASVKTTSVDGDVARVTLSVPYKGRNVEVVVRMEAAGDEWRVVGIENLDEIVDQVDR
jgi:hypothetical protein